MYSQLSSGPFLRGIRIAEQAERSRQWVNVIRVPVIPRGDGRAIRMVLNYLSSLLFSCIYTLSIVCRKRFDFIFVQECPRRLSVYRRACEKNTTNSYLFLVT